MRQKEVIQMRLDKELKSELEKFAKNKDVSMSRVVRSAIKLFLDMNDRTERENLAIQQKIKEQVLNVDYFDEEEI